MQPSLRDIFDGRRPLVLKDLTLPSALRVLMLGPHPDDFDAIGVTLKHLYDNGNPLHVAVVRSGSGVEDSYCTPPTIERMTEVREAEQRKSCAFFGLPDEALTFLDLDEDDTHQPIDNERNLGVVRGPFKSQRPDMVFLPHGNDSNSGHRVMYALFKRAAAAMDKPVAGLLVRDPKTVELRMDVIVPFGEKEAAWKGELLRFHDSQHQRNLNMRGHGFDDRILSVNREIAREAGIDAEYAEAFEVEYIG